MAYKQSDDLKSQFVTSSWGDGPRAARLAVSPAPTFEGALPLLAYAVNLKDVGYGE